MSLIATALKHMLAAGLPHDQIVAAVAEMEANIPRQETADERRRRVSRESSRRLRAKGGDGNASPNVTKRHAEPVTRGDENTSPVTDLRHQTSRPHARVEDINPTKVLTGISLSLERVRECAGDAIASMATHPGIANLAPLTSLLTADPPCEPDEVYGAVSAAAAWHRQRGGAGSMTGWTVARKIALENRDRRLAGAPVNERPHHNPTNAADRRRADTESRRSAWSHAIAERAGGDPRDDERGGSGGDDRDGGGYLRLAHPLAG